MNRRSHAPWLLILCAAALLAMVWPVSGGETNTPPSLVAPPPFPPGYSPVDLFRQLLAMSPDDRNRCLASRPPEIRDRILDKIQEYQALDPDERELRLRATELRWFLLPLMRDPPAQRNAGLAQVPDRIRDLVKARLFQWEMLPPPLQQKFMENERAADYLAHSTNSMAEDSSPNTPTDEEMAHWNALSDRQRNIVAAQFNQFFELTPNEKQQTLNTLSDAERAQMEKTLQSFAALPAGQRLECIRAFNEFAGMSPQDRAEFLKDAQRWSQLSPQERQAWRDLVADVPKWPPTPPGAILLPPPIPPQPRMPIATN